MESSGTILGWIIDVGFMVRAMGYPTEPLVIRWALPFFLTIALLLGLNGQEGVAGVLITAGVLSAIVHLYWRRNFTQIPWSIKRARDLGALFKSVASNENPDHDS
jgi:hypothetical protein